MTTLNRYLLEPMSTLTHLVGAIAAFVALVALLFLTRHDLPKMLSMLIYGGSMVFLYATSTLFHGIKLPEKNRMWLNRLDHMAIFVVIAGTYTPVAYNLFVGRWRWGVLITVWSAAVFGVLYKLFSPRIHTVFNRFIYIVIGWGTAVPLFFASHVRAVIPPGGFVLLLLGGLVYSIGFVIYYLKRPDPWPNVFGHHEIWHLFVMGGTLCHFLFILRYVVPYEPAL